MLKEMKNVEAIGSMDEIGVSKFGVQRKISDNGEKQKLDKNEHVFNEHSL